jgi:hypothetical protein
MDPLKALYATIDEVPEAFRPLYEERGGQFHIAKIEGIKTDADVSRVTRSLEGEKKAHAELKTRWGAFFGDKKPEDIQAMLDRIPELETIASSKNINEEKLNEIVEGRMRSKLAPIERQAQTLQGQLTEAQQTIQQYQQRETTRTIHDGVRGEASKLKVIDSAVDDVLMYAERVFEVTESGEVVTKDGIQGVTPGLSANVWLTEMQQKKPHWWPASKGGGAGGGGGGPDFANNPWSATGWNMTAQGRMYNENPSRAKQLAEAAGTTIGGPRPKAGK